MPILDNFLLFYSTIFVLILNVMIKKIKHRYCQSCGMPFPEYTDLFYGTNKDKSRNTKFCFYCLKNGVYTIDVTMSQMVGEWVKHIDRYNKYSGTHYTPEEIKSILAKRLPRLKRWKQKSETQNIHYRSINEVCRYIDRNLFNESNMEVFYKLSNLSKYHFRRVFKSVTGENIGTYIQRLRLEYIAHLLLNTQMTLDEIAKNTNYQTKASLAKAFRKHFGMSTSEYKRLCSGQVSVKERQKEVGLVPQIQKIQEKTTICLPVADNCKTMENYTLLWYELLAFVNENKLKRDSDKFVSVSLDDPLITSMEQCRFYVGVTTTQTIKTNGKFSMITIPEGIYAIFSFKGSYTLLQKFYREIYEEWLLQNGYRQKGTMSFEVYINTPYEVESTELITDIYFPIEKI